MQEQYELHWKDYYKILMLPKGCGDEAKIKSNYRSLMKMAHADANAGYAHEEDQAKDLNEAYDCLKDADRRAAYWRYHQQREAGSRQEERSSQPPPNDVDDEAFRRAADNYFRRQAEETARRAAQEAARRAADEAERQRREEEERKQREEELRKAEERRKAEEARLAEERRVEAEKRQAAKKAKQKNALKISGMAAAIAAILVVAIVMVVTIPPKIAYERQQRKLQEDYAEAQQLEADGNLTQAIDAYKTLGDYSDAAQRVEDIRIQMEDMQVELKGRELQEKRNILLECHKRFSCGTYHIVGLKEDGTVLTGGNVFGNLKGQSNVSNWRDIVAITAGHYYTLGLKNDGTVLVTGNSYGVDQFSWKKSILDASVIKDGQLTATLATSFGVNADWRNIVQLYEVDGGLLAVRIDGAVLYGGNEKWIKDGIATWSDILVSEAISSYSGYGADAIYGIKADGSVVVAMNPKADDQIAIPESKSIVRLNRLDVWRDGHGSWRDSIYLILTSDGQVTFIGDYKFSDEKSFSDDLPEVASWKLWQGSCYDPGWLK